MRASYPAMSGVVECNGTSIGYEVYGERDPTILLLPTWTIIHSRFWKMQVPYLSRHYRVVTFDGPGNGRSGRVTDPASYAADAYAAAADAVLGECGVTSAFVVGVSLGAAYGTSLANLWPDRVLGLVMIGPSIPLTPPSAARMFIADHFLDPAPPNPSGWDRYNLAHWHADYEDFVRFFFEQCFNEVHSTKPREDALRWARTGGPEYLEAEEAKPEPSRSWPELVAAIDCPTLVIHGTEDRISPYARGVEAARLAAGQLLTLEGSGHLPNVRDPVRVNHGIREFVEQVAS